MASGVARLYTAPDRENAPARRRREPQTDRLTPNNESDKARSMSGFKEPSFADRQKAAQEARQNILNKFRAKPGLDDPAVRQRQAEREAQAAERAKARLAREAAKAEKIAREAEEAAQAAAQLAREKEEAAAREVALEAERKAARDARYAARKKRKKDSRQVPGGAPPPNTAGPPLIEASLPGSQAATLTSSCRRLSSSFRPSSCRRPCPSCPGRRRPGRAPG